MDAKNAVLQCWRTDCRSISERTESGRTVYRCSVLSDTGDFWQYCPFYKTEMTCQAERRQLEKHGHRIEYIPPDRQEIVS